MKILIAGIGALGSNLAALLACDLKGEHEITVLDKDKVEERNVQAGTQFYLKDQVGMSKVEALQYNIYKWYGREIITDNHKIVDGDEFFYDLIIDCLDNHEARKILQDLSENIAYTINGNVAGPELLHIGFSDEFTFAIEWSDNYTVPTDITSGFDICETEGAASFIKMVAALGASLTLQHIKNGSKREFLGNRFNIREIK